MKHRCSICGYIYDDEKEGKPFSELSEGWHCPLCQMPPSYFEPENAPTKPAPAPSPEKTEKSFKSGVLVEQLAREGLRWVFGMVGHSNLGFAEALRQHNPLQKAGRIRFIGIRHEGAAAFAAAAYGKLTHRPAACLSIAGPGATNMSTGVADALLDHAPMLALMGQVPSSEAGEGIFQELPLEQCFAPLTVGCYTQSATLNNAQLGQSSYRKSLDKKGPVALILPDDVQHLEAAANELVLARSERVPAVPAASPEGIAEALRLLRATKRPVIILGYGAEHALDEVRLLAQKLQSPIATTYRAKGYVGDDEPLACGLIGRSGVSVASKFVQEADLILAVGLGFSRHSSLPTAEGKTIIRIDHSAEALCRRCQPSCALLGDAASTLRALLQEWQDEEARPSIQASLAKEWEAWREQKNQRAWGKPSGDGIAPAALLSVLAQLLPAKAIVSVDVGQVAYSVGRYIECKTGQRYLLSYYLGSIGVGLPAAMGAYAATCEATEWEAHPVFAIVGDGGLGQYLAELSTVAKYKMPLKIIVLNNSELAKITSEQELAHYPVWETKLTNPDFAQLARSCGMHGVRIDSLEALHEKLREALAQKGPVLIDVRTCSE